MQNWTGCSQLGMEETVTLVDSRDNNAYTVAKLKDGKCWMTQNLRLVDKTISPEDSDMKTGTFTLPKSNITGFSTYNTSNVYLHQDHGAHYTWFAATAGEGTEDVINKTLTQSICPKNWHLPDVNEASNLVHAYNDNAYGEMLEPPVNFQLNGMISGGQFYETGQRAWVWTSSIGSQSHGSYYSPYFILLSSRGAESKSTCGYYGICGCGPCGNTKFVGDTVRCLVENS